MVQLLPMTQTLASLYQCSAFHIEFTGLGSFGRKAVNTYGFIDKVIKGGGKEKIKSHGFDHTVCMVFIAMCSTAMPFLPESCRKRLNPVVIHTFYS